MLYLKSTICYKGKILIDAFKKKMWMLIKRTVSIALNMIITYKICLMLRNKLIRQFKQKIKRHFIYVSWFFLQFYFIYNDSNPKNTFIILEYF